jgi:hypothetical protein
MDLIYYGQNVGFTTPDVTLTGDPAKDQPAMVTAGYLGGRIMSLKTSGVAGRGPVIVPCDGSLALPFGTLLNGPGEYATSIGVSGSKKAPVVRAMPFFNVNADSYVAAPTTAYAVGNPLYAGTGAAAGMWTSDKPATGEGAVCGICTHIPTTAEPFLGVAQSF